MDAGWKIPHTVATADLALLHLDDTHPPTRAAKLFVTAFATAFATAK